MQANFLTALEAISLKWVSLGENQGVHRQFLSGGSRGQSTFFILPSPDCLLCGTHENSLTHSVSSYEAPAIC